MPEIIPLFPLHTVLYPGGLLPLKIFEARYVDMVSECLQNDSGFGVSLIREGSEVGRAAVTEAVGTYARIVDFRRYPDGLLGIQIQGQQRFRLLRSEIQADNLIRGEIIRIADEQPCPVPARFQMLRDLLLQLIKLDEDNEASACGGLEDAVWLGYRLSELLPYALPMQQELLEITEPLARLERLSEWFSQKGEINRPV